MTEDEFRSRYFAGARDGRRLDHKHVWQLRRKGLYGVGPANAAFIVRNLGGEVVKCDRWILAFKQELGVDLDDLRRVAVKLGWGLGRVDQVIWSYCEQEVGRVGMLARHLGR